MMIKTVIEMPCKIRDTRGCEEIHIFSLLFHHAILKKLTFNVWIPPSPLTPLP